MRGVMWMNYLSKFRGLKLLLVLVLLTAWYLDLHNVTLGFLVQVVGPRVLDDPRFVRNNSLGVGASTSPTEGGGGGKRVQGSKSGRGKKMMERRPDVFPSSAPPSSHHHEFPYRYLINEPDLCGRDTTIINTIVSSAGNMESRIKIRKMWGAPQYTSLVRMKTVFVVATTSSAQHQRDILHESHRYHDMIQLDFVDSYSNLTLKTLSLLHWQQHFCKTAKWILKSDDDIFVNPFIVSDFLRQHSASELVCKVIGGSIVCRPGKRCRQKWAVSWQDYPPERYPHYCQGGAYVVSASMARHLYAAANMTHPVEVEDVYFTGILATPFQPKISSLSQRMFLKITPKSRKHYVGIDAMFIMNLERYNISASSIWKRILNGRNITPLSEGSRDPQLTAHNSSRVESKT
ncbi:beta-1,3-galactosyltransferase 1-like isoform X2 [Homarus americanus]|uniref:beta-1,3-galactosyltransferase 1-like isoform X2 n=1 Tax=Homarus americanus TaxID=6706 RepID=UPI001C4747B3|nr:beta-1,3-galactosyltransferase 1-like isoform X2 [Homarus americanus]